MSQPLTSQQATEFFRNFRRSREREKSVEPTLAAASIRAADTGRYLVTQADQHAEAAAKRVEAGITRIVPMDLSNGTDEERLRRLRISPKNMSPNVPKRNIQALLPMRTMVTPSKVTLVLDVDETLVHSSFQRKDNVRYDAELSITHEGKHHIVYVKYRPRLIEFLAFVSSRFEVVIFTASLSSYCNALMDHLDPEGILGTYRLFREHCTKHMHPGSTESAFVKDLCLLGRDLGRIAIIDNSPNAYLYQQRNAVPIASFFEDERDNALGDLLPLLDRLSQCTSVYDVLDPFNATGLM